MSTRASPWDAGSDVWQSIVEAIPDGVAVVDTEGVKRAVNRAFCEMVGFERSELIGVRPPFPYWPEEHLATIVGVFDRALRRESLADIELTFQRKSGERFPVLVHPAPIYSGGQAVGHVATIKNISERIRMDRALRRSEERWRSIAENPFDFIVIIDSDYRYLYVNHTAPGIDEADLIGKATPFDFVDVEYHEVMHRVFEDAFRHGQAGSYDVYVPLLNAWYTSIVGPILEDGRVIAASILTRDVTTQKQAERALRQSQRMETLGRLAGGIAHDFNNLLTPILGNTTLALGKVAPESEMALYLEDVIKAATRASELVSRILLFGRPASEKPRAVRVQDVAREVVGFIAVGAPAHVRVETCIDDDCAPVAGVPAEIHQIVANLCTNAVQALEPTGGTLRVTVEPTSIDATLARRHNVTEGPAVRIVVEDDGPGIPEENLSRVFDPFFTTRAVGEGTGLGLSIVHAIAVRYGGVALARSQPGGGTSIEVYLPRHEPGGTKRPPRRRSTE